MGKKNKKKRSKKVDIRKKREKLIKKRKKALPKDQQKEKEKKLQPKSEADNKLEMKLERETKLYWSRAISGALSAFIGRMILQFIGWILFYWMLFFWFGFPFVINAILKYKYVKEEWTWKNVIKPGLGIFFFMFMIVGTIIHTFLKFLP